MKQFRDYCVLVVIFVVCNVIARLIKDKTGFDFIFVIGFIAGAIYYDGYKKFKQ